LNDHSNGSRGHRPGERIQTLGATVHRVPPREELPNLIAQITRLWGELQLADPDLAEELAHKLPTAEIRLRDQSGDG
jgi:hypothetical protein